MKAALNLAFAASWLRWFSTGQPRLSPAFRPLTPFLLMIFMLAVRALADPSDTLTLLNQAQVDGQGIFLDQIATSNATASLPHLHLGDAPAMGRALVLTRAQVQALVRPSDPQLATNLCAGADRIRIVRRTRRLGESELKDLLGGMLQKEYVRDRGELELRFSRLWSPVVIPDETVDLKILDIPTAGVSANFIVRFELRTAKEAVGPWQMACQARVWGKVWVAASPLLRGQLLGKTDLVQERRDLLSNHDALVLLPGDESALEVVENISAGSPLLQRSVRLRPVVHRGDYIEGLIQEGPLTISLKVEVLEEGACGQAIRVRNPITKRELRGKVQNEQTILVLL